MYVAAEQMTGSSRAPRHVRRTVVRHEAIDVTDVVDGWGYDSFPASDPPSNW